MKKTKLFDAYISQKSGCGRYHYSKKSFYCFQNKLIKIVQVHLFTNNGDCILFNEGCGLIKPITGQIEQKESCWNAALREVVEEIGLKIDRVYMTLHYFSGISRRGNIILGRTCFAILPKAFSPSEFKFNNEIIGYISLSQVDALSVLMQSSYPEAAESFQYIVKHSLSHIRFK